LYNSEKKIAPTSEEVCEAVKDFLDNGGVVKKIGYIEPIFLWGKNPMREERLYPMAHWHINK